MKAFLLFLVLAVTTFGSPTLKTVLRPEYHISLVKGKRQLRFAWSVENRGAAPLTIDGPFVKLFGQPAVEHVWAVVLQNEATGRYHVQLGAAPVVPLTVLPGSRSVAPGFLTMFDLSAVPDGVYFGQFIFDPLEQWGSASLAAPFAIRITGFEVLDLRLSEP